MGRRQELEQRQSLLARFGRMIAAETHLDSLLTIIAERARFEYETRDTRQETREGDPRDAGRP